jgi:hypothetical protein
MTAGTLKVRAVMTTLAAIHLRYRRIFIATFLDQRRPSLSRSNLLHCEKTIGLSNLDAFPFSVTGSRHINAHSVIRLISLEIIGPEM